VLVDAGWPPVAGGAVVSRSTVLRTPGGGGWEAIR
jgi:hypothetical protein